MATEKLDGEYVYRKSAFPGGDGPFSGGPHHDPGMTLRDWFAGQAIVGLVERWSPSGISASDEIAQFAYLLADAMLKERERK